MRGRAILLVGAMTVAACEPGAEPGEVGRFPADSAGEPAPAPETRALTEGLALWRADGFTMLVPLEADIVPQDPDPPATWSTIVAGPGFFQEGAGGVRQPGPPTYRVDAATYSKPDSLELGAWVAARLAERGEDTGEPGVVVPLAGERAFRTGVAPGAAGAASYWLERDGKVVELRLEEEPESPLGGIQRHVQSLILSTFRWSGSATSGAGGAP
jgi:hypothetical protein